jgi:dihydrofolate reductase
MTVISLVVAVSKNGVIGHDGGLPWHISSDLKRFKAITMGKPVIMGRKTWESLPKRPLPGRRNIVLTRATHPIGDGAETVTSPNEALALVQGSEEVCVIGGGEIYRQFLPLAKRIYLTEVDLEVDGDTQFPVLDNVWKEVSREVHPRGEKDSAGFVLRVMERQLPI